MTEAEVVVPDGAGPDVAAMVTGFGIALHAAGLPVGPDRCERLARAVTVMGATSLADLRACALATMVSDPGQMATFDRVFATLFGGPAPFLTPVPPVMSTFERAHRDGGPQSAPLAQGELDGSASGLRVLDATPAAADGDEPLAEGPVLRQVASAAEALRGRDFTELSPAELRQLVVLMREMTLAIPPRRTRRYRPARDGKRPDLRRTLRLARRSGGEAIRFARRAPRVRPRRLVVLCDISGSMEPYARAMLMLLYVLGAGQGGAGQGGAGQGAGQGRGGQNRSGQNRPEVFSFATRLTRLTPALAAASPDAMLAKAGEAAPDWSGGTRIGAAIKEFNDHYGSRGMARGAVILIISDGWETGDPALLGAQMARLSRVAHRIVWANPRTQSPRYRPEVGGMAAAWPYCDAVVSAHNLDSLDDLLAALRAR